MALVGPVPRKHPLEHRQLDNPYRPTRRYRGIHHAPTPAPPQICSTLCAVVRSRWTARSAADAASTSSSAAAVAPPRRFRVGGPHWPELPTSTSIRNRSHGRNGVRSGWRPAGVAGHLTCLWMVPGVGGMIWPGHW